MIPSLWICLQVYTKFKMMVCIEKLCQKLLGRDIEKLKMTSIAWKDENLNDMAKGLESKSHIHCTNAYQVIKINK